MKPSAGRTLSTGLRTFGRRARLLLLSSIAAAFVIGSLGIAAGRPPMLLYPHKTGISGFSGQQGVNCNRCHGGGIVPTVALDGPLYVLHDRTAAYSFHVTGGQSIAAGLDVAVDAGSLLATESGTHLDSGEVTHDGPKLASGGGEVQWTFGFVAPSAVSTVTMYASGNSVNFNGRDGGDKAASTTFTISVVDNLTSFTESGESLAGSGGLAPRLVGVDGPSAGPWSIAIEQGLGGAGGLLWAGTGTKDQFPLFGGHFYVDLTVPWLALPIQLDGTAGTPGDGSFQLNGGDVSAFAPLTIHLQATLIDAGAIRGVSLTNALQMDVEN